MNKGIVLAILASTVTSITAVSLGAHIYRWELITSDCALFAWVCMAWFWESQARRRP